MKLKLAVVLSLFACLFSGFSQQNKSLRVFIRAGVKTHGPNQHDHPRFLAEWKELLNQRGAGLVVIHDGVVSGDQNEWAKKVQGGSWRWDGDKKTRWLEGDVGIYFVDTAHPITK